MAGARPGGGQGDHLTFSRRKKTGYQAGLFVVYPWFKLLKKA